MKLTKGIKEVCLEAMVSYAFRAREKEAYDYMAQLAYERIMTPQRVALPLFLIQDKWIHTTDSCRLEIYAGMTRTDVQYVNLPAGVPTKENRYANEDIKLMTDEDDSLYAAYKAYDRIVNERASLRQKLKDVMDGCFTDKQLIEFIPEAKDFLPSPESVKALIPADKLNQIRSYFSKEA